jgi:hypothetical protein
MTKELPARIKDDLIRDIIALLTFKEDGRPELSVFSDQIPYSKHVNFLFSILLDEKQDDSRLAKAIRHRIRAKHLLFGKEIGQPLGIELMGVFATLKKGNEDSYESFKIAFYDIINRPINQKGYTVVYPLNLKINTRVEGQIDDKTFKIIDFDEFASSFNVHRILKGGLGNGLKESLDKEFCFLVIEDIYAGNIEFAENYSRTKLHTILGLLVFTKYSPIETAGYRFVSHGLEIPKNAVSNISLSRALIFECRDFIAEISFDEEMQASSFETIEESEVYDFYSYLTYYSKIKAKDIARNLRNAVISYFQASIDNDLATSYLKYWICIEFCLMKMKDDKESKITDILSNLPIWSDKYVVYKLQSLSNKRNEYVHELKTEISQYDRNFAKSIAGGLLNYLIKQGYLFSNKGELRRFYDLLGKDEQALNLALKEVKRLNELN